MCVKQRAGAAAPAAAPTAVTAPHGASAAEASKYGSPSPSRLSSGRSSEPSFEPLGVPPSLSHASATLPHFDVLASGTAPQNLRVGKIAVAGSSCGTSAIVKVTNELEPEQQQPCYDDDNNSSTDSNYGGDAMGQCYPKCMNECVDDGGRILPGMRAKRSSKPRHSLSAMKSLSPSDGGDALGSDALGDLEAIATSGSVTAAMATLDLEELGSERIVTTLLSEPPSSIIVDYEDALESEQQPRRGRHGSISDCMHDACRPLGSEYAQQPAAEDPVLDLKSAPVTPGRRRSRKDSVGNAGAAVASAVTPRRSKTLVQPRREPVSPTTDTDVSDDDERCTSAPKLCLCEVKQHKSRASCWLVVGTHVYDVTGILDVHPGGARSILRKAGGPDCTQDMKFHTKNARRMLEQCFIGKLQPCGDVSERQDNNCSIM